MTSVRTLVVVFLLAACILHAAKGVPANVKSRAGAAYISQCSDSALIGILSCDVRQVRKWSDAMMTIAADSDMVFMAKCLRGCADVADGRDIGVKRFSEAVKHFSYRKDEVAKRGMGLAYCAIGYLDFETSAEPNDIYFKKAEQLAKDAGEARLKAIFLAFRVRLYVRAQRYLEASYNARALLSFCEERDYADIEFFARLYLLRTFSAVRVVPAVSACADAIESNKCFSASPVFASAFNAAMAVDRFRMGKYGEANVYAWGAFDVAKRFGLAKTELWERAFLRALTLFYTGHLPEASALADSCQSHNAVIFPQQQSPLRSPESLSLLRIQIMQESGAAKAVKRYIDETVIPQKIMESCDFALRYYDLVERNSVARGDFASARKAVLVSDSIKREAQLMNAHAISKDFEVSMRSDARVVGVRKNVVSLETDVSNRKAWLTAVIPIALVFAFLSVLILLVKRKRIRKAERLADEEFNEKLAALATRSTEIIEAQNKLISKSNMDLAASRTYAKRMQRGVWPSPGKLVSMGCKSSFVLRGTTEAISSCFYWYRAVGDNIIVCCADTELGDSVSGAMLSFIGVTVFNDAASRFNASSSASSLLKSVDEAFAQCLPNESGRVGIAMSVAVVNTSRRVVSLACAASCGIIINKPKLTAVDNSAYRENGQRESDVPVRSVRVNYSPGDSVFLFTRDLCLIKGANGEILGMERIKSILSHTAKLPPALHRDAVLNEILFWRNGRAFDDDVQLVGFTLN